MNTESTKSILKRIKKILNFDFKWWLGIIIAIATLIATVYIPYILSKKKLQVFFISEAPLVKIDENYKSKLEIIYDGKKIEQAVVSVFQIYNSGSQPLSTGQKL